MPVYQHRPASQPLPRPRNVPKPARNPGLDLRRGFGHVVVNHANQRLLLLSAFALTSALSAALACGSSSSGSSELTGDPSSGGASGGNAGDVSPGGGAGASNQGEDTGDDASDPQGAGGSASGGSSGSGDPSGGGGMNGEAGGSGDGMGGGNTPGLGPVANHCPGDPEDYVLLGGTDGPDVLDDEGQPLRAIIGFPGDDTITTSGTQGGARPACSAARGTTRST